MTTAKRQFSTLRTGLAVGTLALALSACGSTNWGFPYRPDVQQGNWITSTEVAQLEVGMTREQVRFLLGTPTLLDIFRTDRWDYPYYNKPGYGKELERKFTVWFEGDSLVRWVGDEQPDRQPFEKTDTGMSKDGTVVKLHPEANSEEVQDQPQHRVIPFLNQETRPADPGDPQAGQDTTEPLR
ncbi:outer membrane protein assembly factor BamE [Alcaligenaceae bacterium]|nr:outer membrane protein assembly factor BamE [Alcaligenaceae bacterium]